MLQKHFEKSGDNWRVKNHLRTNITFQQMNLNKDFAFLQRFDLVLCRNVLIYFSQDGKRSILDRLARFTNNLRLPCSWRC